MPTVPHVGTTAVAVTIDDPKEIYEKNSKPCMYSSGYTLSYRNLVCFRPVTMLHLSIMHFTEAKMMLHIVIKHKRCDSSIMIRYSILAHGSRKSNDYHMHNFIFKF